MTGSFLVGLVLALLTAKRDLSTSWRYLISIGFLGGYAIFSIFVMRHSVLFRRRIALVLLMWNKAYVLACSQCGEARV